MRKLTNVLDENNKSDFEANVKIKLENGVILEGKFTISDYGLSYARETTSKLVESNIKDVEITSIKPLLEKKRK